MKESKGKLDNSTIIVGDFNTSLSVMDSDFNGHFQ